MGNYYLISKMIFKNLKLLFAASSAVAALTNDHNPGLTASLDLSILSEIKDNYWG